MRDARVIIVLATYNERQNMESLLPALLALPVEPSVIVVDDASPDGTGEIVQQAAREHPGRVILIQRSGKLGYGSAFVAGFRKALETGVDAVVSMDADYSHDPEAIPRLVEALGDADLAIGSRYVDGIRILNWPMRRLLLSKFANTYVNAILRFGVFDCTSGFRAYRAGTLRAIDLDRAGSRGYAFLVELLEMIHRSGLRIVEEPIVYTERREGQSKMSGGVIYEAMLRPWALWIARMQGKTRGADPESRNET